MAEDAAIREMIINLLTDDHLRLTPSDLERAVRSVITSVRRKAFRQAVCNLVSDGKLTYTQHHSTTHLELNYNRPIHIGRRIVLCRSSRSSEIDRSSAENVTVMLRDGTAFGGGDHPTTRMMLEGIDLVIPPGEGKSFQRALDIGTGTGVLAIAAAKLGVARVDAVDIDPAACHEANKNVVLNEVERSVQISQSSLEGFSGVKYDLILANLRPPTILQLIPLMKRLSVSSSKWIISGCRMDECERLKNKLLKSSSRLIWQANMTGWAAFAVDVGD